MRRGAGAGGRAAAGAAVVRRQDAVLGAAGDLWQAAAVWPADARARAAYRHQNVSAAHHQKLAGGDRSLLETYRSLLETSIKYIYHQKLVGGDLSPPKTGRWGPLTTKNW
ncbi:MAG: hypothetical protein AAGD28_03000 [Bacteroidota bacterium]